MRTEIEPLAREAGALALTYFRTGSKLAVDAKGPLDLVTAADRAVERFVTDRLQALFPDDGVFGEEGAAIEGSSGRVWVLDPIDGTFNFVRGGPEWGVSIGLFAGGRPTFGVLHFPVIGQTLSGGQDFPTLLDGAPLAPLRTFDPARGSVSIGLAPNLPLDERLGVLRFAIGEAGLAIRICGSCIAGLAEVARGETDGYIGLAERSWDVMAALPIVEALGADSTIDWPRQTLRSELYFACGRKGFLRLMSPLFSGGGLA